MLNILVASKHSIAPAGLEHLPAHAVMLDSSPGWAASSNALLDAAAEAGEPAIFADDDVTFTAHSLAALPLYQDAADVIGFTLLDAAGRVASAGHVWRDGVLVPRAAERRLIPCYLAHVTTSCIWLSVRALRSGVRFPVWPGVHGEDVAFTYACWLAGLRVAYVPGPVVHPVHAGMVGSTKIRDPQLTARLALNSTARAQWEIDNDVYGAIRRGVVPTGEWELLQ